MYGQYDDDSSQSFLRQNKKKASNRIRRNKADWPSERVIKMIGIVQKHKTIWNVFTEAYKQRDVKDRAWGLVAAAMELDVNECKIKWNSSRVAYRTYMKAVQSSTAGYHKRKNPIFASMWFLEPVLMLESNNPNANNSTINAAPSASSSPSRSERSGDDAQSSIIETKVFDDTRLHHHQEDDDADFDDDDNDPLQARSQPKDQDDVEKKRISNKQLLRQQQRMHNTNGALSRPVPKDKAKAANNQTTVAVTNEWDAFANLIAANAHTWSTENLSFARRYKAALSAVNAQFEMDAVEMCDASNNDDKYTPL